MDNSTVAIASTKKSNTLSTRLLVNYVKFRQLINSDRVLRKCEVYFLKMIDTIDDILKSFISLPFQVETDSSCLFIPEFHVHIVVMGNLSHNLLQFHIVELMVLS